MSVIVAGLNNLEGSSEGTGTRSQKLSYKSFATRPPHIEGPDVVSLAVVSASGIEIGTAWTNDLTSLCRKIISRCLKRIDTNPPKWEWETTLEFSSSSEATKDKDGNPQEPTTQKDPKQRPITVVSVSVERYESPANASTAGYPVTNSADDPIIRTRKRSRVVFRYTKYLDKFYWQDCEEAIGNMAINPETGALFNAPGFLYSRNYADWVPAGQMADLIGFAKVPRGQARIEDIHVTSNYEFGRSVKVDVEVHVDKLAFEDRFLDQGFFHYATANPYTEFAVRNVDPNNPYATDPARANASALPSSPSAVAPVLQRRRFRDGAGFATSPQLLDGAGNPLPIGTQPVERRFQYYPFRDWNQRPFGGPGGYFS